MNCRIDESIFNGTRAIIAVNDIENYRQSSAYTYFCKKHEVEIHLIGTCRLNFE